MFENDLFQRGEALFQLRYLRFLLFQFRLLGFDLLVQTLDGRQRDAAFVNRRNMFVVRPDVETTVKILRHRADVPGRWIVLVAPLADGQLQDFVQNLRRAYLGKNPAWRCDHSCC